LLGASSKLRGHVVFVNFNEEPKDANEIRTHD